MEKLLELLNEYDGTPNERKLVVDKLYLDGLNFNSELFECLIISKYYGFIQRLVENDKINEIKLSCVGTDDMQYYYSEEDILLMLLSIQDDPIQFLIDILA